MLFPRLPVAHFAGMILRGEPFAFSRWNAATWDNVLDRPNATAKQPVREQLRSILQSRPKYLMGMHPASLCVPDVAGQIRAWLAKEELDDLAWCDGDVFHAANCHNRLAPLLYAMHRRSLVVVGPGELAPLQQSGFLRYGGFVRVDRERCWENKDGILTQLHRILAPMVRPITVAISASILSNFIIDNLVHTEQGLMLLDMGSVWEPYIGNAHREYQKLILPRCVAEGGIKLETRAVVMTKGKKISARNIKPIGPANGKTVERCAPRNGKPQRHRGIRIAPRITPPQPQQNIPPRKPKP